MGLPGGAYPLYSTYADSCVSPKKRNSALQFMVVVNYLFSSVLFAIIIKLWSLKKMTHVKFIFKIFGSFYNCCKHRVVKSKPAV